MNKKLLKAKIDVKRSPKHGYGVFAAETIKKGRIIEQCVLIISKGRERALEDYYFQVKKGKYVILTGCGIIYNHADKPNADYHFDLKRRIATFKATQTIRKGEEINISYGPQWFSSRGKKPKD
jgi:SET domain-containing protein